MSKGRTKEQALVIRRDAEAMHEGTKGLSDRERLFVAYYIQFMDATRAADMAGYTENYESRKQIAYSVLKRPSVRAAIDAHMLNVFMETAEMKMRLSDQARASMGDFIEIDEKTGEFKWDLKKAKINDRLHLIRKLKTKEKYIKGIRIVETELELYSSQDALVQIGRLHNLFKELPAIRAEETDTPFDLMAKAYQAGIEKGEKIKKCRQSSK